MTSLVLASCSTTFMAMRPARPDGPWVNGHPTSLTRHPDSVAVRLGFVRYEPQELVFETEFANSSDQPVHIAPGSFYFMPLPDTLRPDAPTPPRVFISRVMALDPEVRLGQLHTKLDEEDRKATRVSVWEILTGLSHVAEDVASISKKETTAQIEERNYRHESDNAFFEEQRQQHAQKADRLYEQSNTLQAITLRNTTLEPGQRLRGHVFFPRRDEVKKMRLVVFFNERPVWFDFTQSPEKHSY